MLRISFLYFKSDTTLFSSYYKELDNDHSINHQN